MLSRVSFKHAQFGNASKHKHVGLNDIMLLHVLSVLCVGTQPDQQFYDTSLFSPASGPFSVNNCTLTVNVLPTNDPPVIDVALSGTYLNN